MNHQYDRNIRNSSTRSGFSAGFLELLGKFSDTEQKMLHKLSDDWYMTNSGSKVHLSRDTSYSYFLMKPASKLKFKEIFNLDLQILCWINPFENFNTRMFDVFEKKPKDVSEVAMERLCQIFISADQLFQGVCF